MNICYLSRTFHRYRGGIESYTYQMARALSALGHRVHIITMKGEENFYLEDLGKNVMIHKIAFHPEPFYGAWRVDEVFPFSHLYYAKAVASELNAITQVYKIDIIETPGFTEGFWPVLNRKIPFFQRLHGYHGLIESYNNNSLKNDFKKKLIWNLEREVSMKAQGISSVSEEFGKRCQEIWQYQSKSFEVIFSGINLEEFKPDPSLKRELSVMFVGRLQESKGIGVLAKAIPLVLKEFPETKFYFAGRDSNQSRPNPNETWKEYITRSFSAKNLIFLGQLSTQDLIKYYQKIAIGVFPSLYEPGGTVACESMACGCVTIATKAGGFTELIEDGHDGFLVPPGDEAALAQAIIQALRDEKLRAKISANAVQANREKFNLDKIVDQTLKAYQRSIDNFYSFNYGRRSR